MNKLVAMASPRSAVAIRVASTSSVRLWPAASWIAANSESLSKGASPSRVNADVGATSRLTTALVRPPPSLASASAPPAVTASQASSSRAFPAAMRTACSSSGAAAMRTWLTTAPFFWASPDWSSTVTPLSSKWAAMPRIAPMVTTPVPPMPVTRMS